MTDDRDPSADERFIVRADPELQDLIPGYLANRRTDIVTMLAALERSDWETIRSLGHSMKGSGGGYGFDVITEIGGSLEQAARAQDPAGIKAWLDELAAYLERVEIVYE